MVSEGQSRLIININDLRRRNEKRAKESVTLLRFCENRKYNVTLLVGLLPMFPANILMSYFESFGLNTCFLLWLANFFFFF